jgi:putative ABC transport system permease protein
MLSLIGIVKNYYIAGQVFPALKGADLQFRNNEFVSILCPSGCGKTTMLNIIGGLDRYTSGDLLVDGKSTKNFKEHEWDAYRNATIGFVFQTYNLISHLSVLDNVEMSLRLSGVPTKERRQRALKVLDEVGLTVHVNKRPNQESGGQKQRVAIARALINNPKVL